jgi:hypothetical protein
MPAFYHVGTKLAEGTIQQAAKLDQCLEVDIGILTQDHCRTESPIKHPRRNLEASERYI